MKTISDAGRMTRCSGSFFESYVSVTLRNSLWVFDNARSREGLQDAVGTKYEVIRCRRRPAGKCSAPSPLSVSLPVLSCPSQAPAAEEFGRIIPVWPLDSKPTAVQFRGQTWRVGASIPITTRQWAAFDTRPCQVITPPRQHFSAGPRACRCRHEKALTGRREITHANSSVREKNPGASDSEGESTH
jgi:hypothetical protein